MKKVVINIEDYLKPTATIDCDNEAIKEKAKNITKRQDRVADKARTPSISCERKSSRQGI
jgi:hypothetical protein